MGILSWDYVPVSNRRYLQFGFSLLKYFLFSKWLAPAQQLKMEFMIFLFEFIVVIDLYACRAAVAHVVARAWYYKEHGQKGKSSQPNHGALLG